MLKGRFCCNRNHTDLRSSPWPLPPSPPSRPRASAASSDSATLRSRFPCSPRPPLLPRSLERHDLFLGQKLSLPAGAIEYRFKRNLGVRRSDLCPESAAEATSARVHKRTSDFPRRAPVAWQRLRARRFLFLTPCCQSVSAPRMQLWVAEFWTT